MTEEALFHEALALSTDARTAFLDHVCAGKPELRASVEKLLAAHDGSGEFLDAPEITGDFTPDPANPTVCAGARPGIAIAGRYTLEQKIGEGGMGEVWVAKQSEPVKRKVALKLIKAGMDSKAVLQRFEQERQALAMMDHPNIAKVLDGGLTGEPSGVSRRIPDSEIRPLTRLGSPYFVMELVNGLPLTKFCDEAKLGIRERLELFVPICQAVQHAHQKGIVHRDLKPSNILVTMIDGKPVPKVIDFGVAKAFGGKLTDESFSTQFGSMVGTLEYMAPEQAGYSGTDVDTRADIYSLGVILYELLTGLKPFDRKRLLEAAFDEAIRMIREEEPSKPSTRLSTDKSLPSLAAVRQIEPKQLTRLLRGELDWVVMKCLEKQRDRRYETANGLARDVQRYLADEPVEARPVSAGYRLRKLIRRNRLQTMAIGLVALSLLVGLIGTTWGMVRANTALHEKEEQRQVAENAKAEEERQKQLAQAAERKEAEQARSEKKAKEESQDAQADTEAFASFLTNHVLASSRPEGVQHGLGINTTMLEMLEKAEPRIAEAFRDRPKAEARTRHALGVTWRNLSRFKEAEVHFRRAIELFTRELGPDHDLTLNSENSLAVMFIESGRVAEAAKLVEKIIEGRRRTLGDDDPKTWKALKLRASIYKDHGRTKEAIALLREIHGMQVKRFGADDPDTLQTAVALGGLLWRGGSLNEAIELLEPIHDLFVKKNFVQVAEPMVMASLIDALAQVYRTQGKMSKAIGLQEQLVQLVVENVGPKNQVTLGFRANLAVLYLAVGRHEESLKIFEEIRPLMAAQLPADHPDLLAVQVNIGEVFRRVGRKQEAIKVFQDTIAQMEKRFKPDHWQIFSAKASLATALAETGRSTEAIAIYEKLVSQMERVLGELHQDTLASRYGLGQAYRAAGRHADAIAILEKFWKQNVELHGRNNVNALLAERELAFAIWDGKSVADAIPLLEHAHDEFTKQYKPHHSDTIDLSLKLLDAYQKTKRLDDLFKFCRRLESDMRQQEPVPHESVAELMAMHGRLRLVYKFPAEAELVLRECLNYQKKHCKPGWQSANTEVMLGAALARQGKHAEAEPLLLAGHKGLKAHEAKLTPATRIYLQQSYEELAALYDKMQRKADAEKWRSELKAYLAPRPMPEKKP